MQKYPHQPMLQKNKGKSRINPPLFSFVRWDLNSDPAVNFRKVKITHCHVCFISATSQLFLFKEIVIFPEL
jgi:hypothetical protein